MMLIDTIKTKNKRTLVIGDIHGGLKALKQVLERAEVTISDTLIFLGDYVDGWSESPQVLDFLIALKQTHHCIYLRGNHDELLQNWLETDTYNEMWHNHGGKATRCKKEKGRTKEERGSHQT